MNQTKPHIESTTVNSDTGTVTISTILCYNKSGAHSNYPHTSSHGISLQVRAADMGMDYGLRDTHYAMDDNELSIELVAQI